MMSQLESKPFHINACPIGDSNYICIFFLCDRYVTLGIRFGSCFSNCCWLQVSVIEKDWIGKDHGG